MARRSEELRGLFSREGEVNRGARCRADNGAFVEKEKSRLPGCSSSIAAVGPRATASCLLSTATVHDSLDRPAHGTQPAVK